MMKFSAVLSTTFLAFSLSACGGSGGGGGNPSLATNSIEVGDDEVCPGSVGFYSGGNAGDSDDTRAIAGLWDISEETGFNRVDVKYWYLNDQGSGRIYDYRGDSDSDFYGEGENCYSDRFAGVTNLCGGQYDIGGGVVPQDSNNDGLATAVIIDGQLSVTDSEGTRVFPPVIGLSVTDFTGCR